MIQIKSADSESLLYFYLSAARFQGEFRSGDIITLIFETNTSPDWLYLDQLRHARK